MAERADRGFADRQGVFNEAFIEALVQSDTGSPELKLIVFGIIVWKDGIMNKAAVRNERLLGTDAKKCETAQAETARLLADEIVVVPAVPHPHGIQPCVHAAAELNMRERVLTASVCR